jgi:DNA-binding GntR family transcriptional regulator
MTWDAVLDRNSPVPLYYQLSQQLEAAIASGAIAPGERIDTEVEIAERYGLSRPTVRQAIQELVNKGLLVRRRGVGTQVVPSQLRRRVELTSLYDDLERAQHRPSTRVLALEPRRADATVAAALGIAVGDEVLYVERLRFDGEAPLAHMHNWLPGDVLTAQPDELESGGLYDLMRRAGVQMRVANQRIGARAADRIEARLLDVKTGAPLLVMERTAFDDTGRAVEFGKHAYRSDSYSFETTLVER